MATIHFNSLVLAHLQNRWPIITQGCGAEWDETIYPLSLYLCMALLGVDAEMGWLSSCNPNSLHNRCFMSQAGWMRYFTQSVTRAQSARRGEENNKNIFLFSSSCALRSSRALRKILHSPRLAHKAPVMQAITQKNQQICDLRNFGIKFSPQ